MSVRQIVKYICLIIGLIFIVAMLPILGLAFYSQLAYVSLRRYEPQITYPHTVVDHQVYSGNRIVSTVWQYCVNTNIDELLGSIKDQLPETVNFERGYTFMVSKTDDNPLTQFFSNAYSYTMPRLQLDGFRSSKDECNGVVYWVIYQWEHH